jgi:hypothetical protein
MVQATGRSLAKPDILNRAGQVVFGRKRTSCAGVEETSGTELPFPGNWNPAAFCHRSPHQMIMKQAKKANAARYRSFSAGIPMWFKLSSVPHTAYRALRRAWPVCGDRQFVIVFDPAETT